MEPHMDHQSLQAMLALAFWTSPRDRWLRSPDTGRSQHVCPWLPQQGLDGTIRGAPSLTARTLKNRDLRLPMLAAILLVLGPLWSSGALCAEPVALTELRLRVTEPCTRADCIPLAAFAPLSDDRGLDSRTWAEAIEALLNRAVPRRIAETWIPDTDLQALLEGQRPVPQRAAGGSHLRTPPDVPIDPANVLGASCGDGLTLLGTDVSCPELDHPLARHLAVTLTATSPADAWVELTRRVGLQLEAHAGTQYTELHLEHARALAFASVSDPSAPDVHDGMLGALTQTLADDLAASSDVALGVPFRERFRSAFPSPPEPLRVAPALPPACPGAPKRIDISVYFTGESADIRERTELPFAHLDGDVLELRKLVLVGNTSTLYSLERQIWAGWHVAWTSPEPGQWRSHLVRVCEPTVWASQAAAATMAYAAAFQRAARPADAEVGLTRLLQAVGSTLSLVSTARVPRGHSRAWIQTPAGRSVLFSHRPDAATPQRLPTPQLRGRATLMGWADLAGQLSVPHRTYALRPPAGWAAEIGVGTQLWMGRLPRLALDVGAIGTGTLDPGGVAGSVGAVFGLRWRLAPTPWRSARRNGVLWSVGRRPPRTARHDLGLRASIRLAPGQQGSREVGIEGWWCASAPNRPAPNDAMWAPSTRLGVFARAALDWPWSGSWRPNGRTGIVVSVGLRAEVAAPRMRAPSTPALPEGAELPKSMASSIGQP